MFLYFQEKHCLVAEVSQRINDLKENLTHMRELRGKNLRRYERISADGTFKGIQITRHARRGEGNLADTVNRDIDHLLNDSIFFLEERFIKHLAGEPHSWFNVFNFKTWPNKDTNVEEFRVYGDKEIESLANRYSPLLSEEETETAVDQWLNLKLTVNRVKTQSVLGTYEHVMGLPEDSEEHQKIKSILPIINIMLSISPTTAECERGFSTMNMIKTQGRTSMSQSTLQSLVRINVDGPKMENFSATKSIVHWMDCTPGTRHIRGHKLSGPRGPRARNDQASESDSDTVSVIE